VNIRRSVQLRHYDYIDALRGYAVLGVIAVHTAQSVPGLQGPLQAVAAAGRYGVQLFFVVSALTLMLSWCNRREDVISFYTRRFFRIAPMFWLAIAFYSVFHAFGSQGSAFNSDSLNAVLPTMLFMHGWHPATINSVVPGGWSIAVEATFYMIFPALAAASLSWRSVRWALLTSFVLAILLNSVATKAFYIVAFNEPEPLVSMFKSFWFFNQLPVFIVGISVYFALLSKKPSKLILDSLLNSALVAMYVSSFVKIFPGHIQYALCFGLLTYCLGSGAGGFIVNRFARQLGKVSYSCYIWHFAVIELVMGSYNAMSWLELLGASQPSNSWFFTLLFLVVTLVTAGLSSLTYRLIEQPMIRFGNSVVRSLAGTRQVAEA